MYSLPENGILCGALGSLFTQMLGIQIDPAISAGLCSYMVSSQGNWLYRIVQGLLGHVGRTMVFPEPSWYRRGRVSVIDVD